MAEGDNFAIYIESHPEFYPIVKSSLFMNILESLDKNAKSIEDLKIDFPAIEREDFELIIKSLKNLDLVGEVKAGHKTLFYPTDLCKDLLKRYRNAKHSFFG